MRILQVCNKIPYPKHDGGSIAIFNLAQSLSRLGHEVTILSMLTEKHGISGTERSFLGNFVRLYTVKVKTRISWPALLQNFLFSRIPYVAERFISETFR